MGFYSNRMFSNITSEYKKILAETHIFLQTVYIWEYEIIHLIRKQNIPKIQHILTLDTHTCVSRRKYQGVRNVSFAENFMYVLNG